MKPSKCEYGKPGWIKAIENQYGRVQGNQVHSVAGSKQVNLENGKLFLANSRMPMILQVNMHNYITYALTIHSKGHALMLTTFIS